MAGYLGNAPTAVPLTSADITDGIITSAKIANGAIVGADINSTFDLTGKTVTLPAGTGGKVLQVVQTYKTDTFNTTSSTLVDITGLSATITPSSTSSKILVMTNIGGASRASGAGNWKLVRGSTQIGNPDSASNRSRNAFSGGMWITSDHGAMRAMVGTYLDSPATTSATTYKIQAANGTGGAINVNRTNDDTDSEDAGGRMTSSITLWEIAG
jgi:hypothetical protein